MPTKKTTKKTTRRKTAKAPSSYPGQIASSIKSGITSIKVIGIGGGGGNAVTRMMEADRVRGVEFIAANTDAQDLNYASSHKKVYMGKALTKGLGSGMNPDVGKQSAEENRSEIGELMEGADVVFITAGLGGGTGTGASPIIAEIARERGILTVGIVTKPFSFEGTQRMSTAQEGLNRLKDKVDTLVVIPNDRIFSIIDKETSVARAFAHVDEILKNAVYGIAEIINTPGIINVDFADIRTVMKDAGTALIGIGTAAGQDRAAKAAAGAINSPLLETSIEGAKGVLFSIAGSKDLKMTEVNEVAKAVSASADPSAKIIFGAYYDRRLKDKALKVTVIATGFNGSQNYGSTGFEMPNLFQQEDTKSDFLEELYKEGGGASGPVVEESHEAIQKQKKNRAPQKNTEENKGSESDSWDLPAFLRRGKKK
jgi:cell division protein FtsZ